MRFLTLFVLLSLLTTSGAGQPACAQTHKKTTHKQPAERKPAETGGQKQEPQLAPEPEPEKKDSQVDSGDASKSKPLQGGVARFNANLQGQDGQGQGALRGNADDTDWFHPVLKSNMSEDDFRKCEFGITGFVVRRVVMAPYPTVVEVIPGCPAEQAGVRVGDVLLRANNHQFTQADMQQEYWRILDGKAGSTVTVVVMRGYIYKTFKLTRMNIEDIPDEQLRRSYEALVLKLGAPMNP